MKSYIASMIAVSALVAAGSSAMAAGPIVMMQNGSPTNRVDMVVLGDGYLNSAAHRTKFKNDTQKFIDKFFAFTPFKEYRKYFNVSRIETKSARTGAANGNPGQTALGAHFCFNSDRLICIDQNKVENVLDQNGLTGTKRDVVIVLVNEPKYGGSGGPIAVASTNEWSADVAIHELGHSFGHLDDEYEDPYLCGGDTILWGFNVTQARQRPKIPWKAWIAPATPVPTPERPTTPFNVPGLYQGAFYCKAGWYRPTMSSMMNGLGLPFYQVNTEQLIRRIYEFSSPLNSVAPGGATITIPRAGNQVFTARAIDPALKMTYTWRINGVVQPTKTQSLTVPGNSFGASATLEVIVRDATLMVRKDPGAKMIEKRTWTIKRGT